MSFVIWLSINYLTKNCKGFMGNFENVVGRAKVDGVCLTHF